MSTRVPLGVRIWNTHGHAVDTWVTRFVNDLTYRCVVPGGFANATITLHNTTEISMDLVARILNRVQIVDLRSQEIAWEGRIDTIRRQTDNDTWELGCLGSMIVASDIQRPMFYIDSSSTSWVPAPGATGELFNATINGEGRTIAYSPRPGAYSISGGHVPLVASFWGAQKCAVFIGRFDATYTGSATSSAARTGMDVVDSSGARQTNVDLSAWRDAPVRKTNRVGTDITSTTAQRLEAAWDISGGSYTVTKDDFGGIELPVVQAQRMDETGSNLVSASDYPAEFLTVEQIVRDVVGRFMVGGWYEPANNVPYPGQVGSEGIYIDTSGTAQITHLTYYDGTTAAQILNDLMEAQPDAYWALWESRYGATTDPNPFGRFRFEWATWPSSYSYQATSIDGLEEQPDGGQLVNFVWLQHELTSPVGMPAVQQYWDTGNENQLITDAQIVRGVTVQASEPISASDAFDRAKAVHASFKKTTNTGTLTVRRPIQAYDAGTNSNRGISGSVDPWMIRPGKLIRITDIPPRSNGNTFAAGEAVVTDSFDGRTVAAGWGTADTGQAWTTSGGDAADYSVSSGFGRVAAATTGASRNALIPAPGADFDVRATLATDAAPTGASQFIYIVGRALDTSNAYVARVEFTTTGTVELTIRKRIGGSETSLAGGAVAGLTYAAGRRFCVRFAASGDSLKAKIWQASGSEPSAWTTTAEDTDLTAAGSVGHRVIIGSGSTVLPNVTFDNFTATAPQPFAPELDGTVFRVVGTTYSSADNACVLELDQPPAWDTATQVLESGSGGSNLIVRG